MARTALLVMACRGDVLSLTRTRCSLASYPSPSDTTGPESEAVRMMTSESAKTLSVSRFHRYHNLITPPTHQPTGALPLPR